MKKLEISLQNCFGIDHMDCTIDFSNCNACTIYARNGMMKTSFSNTFQCLQEKKIDKIQDKIFGIPAAVDVKADGKDINSDHIFVIKSYESYYESKGLTSLLVNSSMKNMIDQLLNLQKSIFADLSNKSGVKPEKTEGGKKVPVLEPILIHDLHLERQSFLLSLDEIYIDENKPYFGDIKYSDVLDEGVIGKILTDEFQKNIDAFLKKAVNVCAKYPFLELGKLTLPGLNKISGELKKRNFFVNNNQLRLNGDLSIASASELENKIKDAMKELNTTKEFKQLEKYLSDARGMALRNVLESHQEIIPYLAKDKIDELRTLFWNSYLLDVQEKFQQLKDAYNNVKTQLSKDKFEKTPWEKALAIFNSRFTVPFTMKIANKESAILGESLPRVEFYFEKKNTDDVTTVSRNKLEQLGTLSQGERRALYLLNIIFDIEQRKLAGLDTLYIIDDIADSFDYKNKYAIIEYLYDLQQDPNNHLIILSHNFDFYRTVSSRLGIARGNRFIAELKSDDKIELREETYQKVFFNACKNECKNGAFKDHKKFLAMIPFVRNLIEFGYDYNVLKGKYKDINNDKDNGSDQLVLTLLLHLKRKTQDITIEDISRIYGKYLFGDEGKVFKPKCYQGTQTVFPCLQKVADEISEKDVKLENKIILSMVIRLQAEAFMIDIIRKNGDEFYESTSNQTRDLITQIKKKGYLDPKLDEKILHILDAVNIVTPEQIHINSFMYEPLVDMDIIELLNLYKDVKGLNSTWKEIHEEHG